MIKTITFVAYILSQAYGTVNDHFEIKSKAFPNKGKIPAVYTCRGRDISFPLRWRGVPTGTQSLTLIISDPDAPGGTWYHWALYNLPRRLKRLPKDGNNFVRKEDAALNSWHKQKYRGPCPPSGTHRYIVRLYALDTSFYFTKPPSAAELIKAMRHHVIASTELVGTFGRPKKKMQLKIS